MMEKHKITRTVFGSVFLVLGVIIMVTGIISQNWYERLGYLTLGIGIGMLMPLFEKNEEVDFDAGRNISETETN